ncbi:MAG: HPr family phosphocarrier protein [Bacilli bacterium]|jgi:phosphotransferase system HPr (HPr) family protein|nr:HPr family phosphocarrier protein [Bacilli bacterium]
MKTVKIKVNNMGGLTSRSSAELVEEANHHKCNVTMKLENGDECDLKSIMNVFALSPIDTGALITIECDGADEDDAVEGFNKLCSEYSF